MNMTDLLAEAPPKSRRRPQTKLKTRGKRFPSLPVNGQRQVEWENAGVQKAKELFRASGKSITDLPLGKPLLKSILEPLADRIAQVQADAQLNWGSNGRPPAWQDQIFQLKPELLAVITTNVALRSITPKSDDTDRPSIVVLAKEISAAVRTTAEFYRWLNDQKEQGKTHDAIVREIGERPSRMSPRSWAAWQRKFGRMQSEPPAESVDIAFGTKLLEILLKDERFKKYMVRIPGDSYRTQAILQLSDDLVDEISDLNVRAEAAMPRLLPMLIPPLDWNYADGGKATGGYLSLQQPLIRANPNGRGADVSVSASDLRALNVIQRTAWHINRRVLDVMIEAWERRMPVLITPNNSERIRMPERVSDIEWAAMDEENKKQHRETRRKVHQKREEQRKEKVRELAFLDKLVVARAMADEPRIYYPYNRDFRMRIYPIPMVGPHPQSDDAGKALIEFADGLQLGERGLHWLCIRAANCAGHDKLPLDQRVAWTLSMRDAISAAAAKPLDTLWWAESKQRWSFLATCFELAEAWKMRNKEEFVSHLPVPMDATCSGLQHLSAMALDPVVAEKVNLADGNRQDIYQEIAFKVAAQVERDAANGDPRAQSWLAKVTREVVKQPIMTTPYGVTERGIRDQLKNLIDKGKIDLECGDQKHTWETVDYFAKLIDQVRGAVMPSAMEIMRWLQETAEYLANKGKDFKWTTPTGSICRQSYLVLKRKRISTPLGTFSPPVPKKPQKLDVSKQRSGAAPNFVHSLDAAHLSMTVVRCL